MDLTISAEDEGFLQQVRQFLAEPWKPFAELGAAGALLDPAVGRDGVAMAGVAGVTLTQLDIGRGDPAEGRFAVFHLKGDLLQLVEAVNAPPEFMMGKQLILSRRRVDKTKLADPPSR